MVSALSNQGGQGNGNLRNLQTTSPFFPAEYKLVGVPIVYHILEHQGVTGSGVNDNTNTRATNSQLDNMTNQTNRRYTIYDKISQAEVEWATFVQDSSDVMRHDVSNNNGDCDSISTSTLGNFVTQADGWQFKIHAIICESTSWSGYGKR